MTSMDVGVSGESLSVSGVSGGGTATVLSVFEIASVRNRAFAHRCIQANLLSPPQLSSMLAVKHTKEE
jgi:hypothetical protein